MVALPFRNVCKICKKIAIVIHRPEGVVADCLLWTMSCLYFSSEVILETEGVVYAQQSSHPI